jgi:hypothetical protein
MLIPGEPGALKGARPVRRGLRHEVMSVFVMRSSSTHNPVFYHGYATRTCGTSNRTVRSSWDNVCLTSTGGPRTVRNKDDCERHRGRELAWNGRVNSGEPLINVVRTNKPKTLRGLSQNGMWRGVRVSLFSYRRRNATGEQAGPTPFRDTDMERGKPTRRPQGKANRKGSRSTWGYGRMEKANAVL